MQTLGDLLRSYRAVEILERIGTSETRRLLASYAIDVPAGIGVFLAAGAADGLCRRWWVAPRQRQYRNTDSNVGLSSRRGGPSLFLGDARLPQGALIHLGPQILSL